MRSILKILAVVVMVTGYLAVLCQLPTFAADDPGQKQPISATTTVVNNAKFDYHNWNEGKLKYFYSYLYTPAYYGGVGENQILDLSSAWQDFENIGVAPTGIYGGGHFYADAVVKALDKDNKLLGQKSVKAGDCLFDFPGARKLQIIGPKTDVSLIILPQKPFVVTQESDIGLGDLPWVQDTDGLNRAYMVVAMPNTSMQATIVRSSSNECYISEQQNIFDKTLVSSEIGVANTFRVVEYYTKTLAGAADQAMHIRQLHTVCENSFFKLQSSSEAHIPGNLGQAILDLYDELLKQAKESFLADTKPFNKVDITVIPTMDSWAGGNFVCLSPKNADLDCPADYGTITHEMAHILDNQNADFPIPCFKEGFAEVLSDKVMKAKGIAYDVSEDMAVNPFSEQQLNDLENCLKSHLIVDEHSFGYYFVKYIIDVYGNDVVKRVSKLWTKQTDRTEEKFMDVIKQTTSDTVFSDFKGWFSNRGNSQTVAVTGVRITKQALSLNVGECEKVTALLQPVYASNRTMQWKSKNPSVATVDQDGLVTAMGSGDATISVTAQEGNQTASCNIKVNAPRTSESRPATTPAVQPTVEPTSKPEPKPVIKPVAPTALKVTISGTRASLTWQPVTGATSYKVYYKRQNRSYKVVTTNATTIRIPNVSKSTKYYFKVSAVNEAGEGDASTEVAAGK